jgi:hypothetical protein
MIEFVSEAPISRIPKGRHRTFVERRLLSYPPLFSSEYASPLRIESQPRFISPNLANLSGKKNKRNDKPTDISHTMNKAEGDDGRDFKHFRTQRDYGSKPLVLLRRILGLLLELFGQTPGMSSEKALNRFSLQEKVF